MGFDVEERVENVSDDAVFVDDIGDSTGKEEEGVGHTV